MNLYSYAHNNPILYVDPTGHEIQYGNLYTGADGKLHQQFIRIDGNSGGYELNPDVVYDNIYLNTITDEEGNGFNLISSSSVNKINVLDSSYGVVIKNSGDIDTVATGTGSGTYIENNGTIRCILTGTGSTTNVGNSGTIGKIWAGESSVTNISNDGVIDRIYSDPGASMSIQNYGDIGLVNTGSKSYTGINNFGTIGSIDFWEKSTSVIANSGNIGFINVAANAAAGIYNSGYIGEAIYDANAKGIIQNNAGGTIDYLVALRPELTNNGEIGERYFVQPNNSGADYPTYAGNVFKFLEDYGNAFMVNDPIQPGSLPGAYGRVGSFADNALGAILMGIGKAGRYASGADDAAKLASQGYKTFNGLKKALGSPGTNSAWHHIVEKSQIAKSGFDPTIIHNTSNIISVDNVTHAKISGHYASKLSFTGGKTVRDWLAGQSFEDQYKYGVEILKKFGVIK